MRKALLAGGAVLGIGASATLATWSDDSWVSGLFNTLPKTTRATFEIQTALAPDAFDESGDHDDAAASQMVQPSGSQDLTGFSAPVSLAPGQTTYLPVYLRTSQSTESDALVTISPARDTVTGDAPANSVHTPPAIWGGPDSPGYVTYGARVQPLDDPPSPPECGAEFFDMSSPDATDLIGGATPATPATAAPVVDAAAAAPAPASTTAGLVPMNAETPTTQFAIAGEAKSTHMVCFRFHLDPQVVTGAPELNGAPFQPSWTFTGEAMDQ